MQINLTTDKFLIKLPTQGGELELEFKKPSYKLYLEMIKRIQSKGENEAGFVLLEYLPKLLSRWNLQDPAGNPIPITEATVEAFLSKAMTELSTTDGRNLFAAIVEEFSKFLNKDQNFTQA